MGWNQIKNWAYLTFWVAAAASVVGPCVSLNRAIDDIGALAEASRNYVQDSANAQAGERFSGIIINYHSQRKKGQQEAIRTLRRNIADAVGVNCPALEREEYEMPEFTRNPQGEAFMTIKCEGAKPISFYLTLGNEHQFAESLPKRGKFYK